MLGSSKFDEKLIELLSLASAGNSGTRSWALTQAVEFYESTRSRKAFQIVQLLARAFATDADVSVRREAIEVLDWAGTRRDRLRIETALRDSDWVVQASGIEAAVTLLGARALPHARAMLKSKNEYARAFACEALHDLIGCEAVQEVREVLPKQVGDPLARIRVLGVLAECGDKAAYKELRQLARDSAKRTSETARKFIANLKMPR